LRSVNSIVIAPARTGKDNRSRIAVNNTLHTYRGINSSVIPSPRMLIIVVMKFTAPKILLIPARCNAKIPKSTDLPAWPTIESGGYTVHPVPTPLSTIAEADKRKKAGGISQNLILFIRGKAISGALIISGTSQFPKPPIIVGMTKKKIITKACAVTITLYN